MTGSPWAQALRLDIAPLARAHAGFARSVAAARAALEAGDRSGALSTVERLLDHAVEWFCREERWMKATDCPRAVAHALQHEVALQLMCESVRLARVDAQWEPLRSVVHGLAAWIAEHARTMDADLAAHLARVACGPANGETPAPSSRRVA